MRCYAGGIERATLVFLAEERALEMSEGFWPVLLIIAIVAAWVLSKVFFYMRKSEEQWREVDKTKLKKWEDDDD